MSALDELKKKEPMDLTMLEYVVTESENRELGGNAEEAAEELAALRARVDGLEKITKDIYERMKQDVDSVKGVGCEWELGIMESISVYFELDSENRKV